VAPLRVAALLASRNFMTAVLRGIVIAQNNISTGTDYTYPDERNFYLSGSIKNIRSLFFEKRKKPFQRGGKRKIMKKE
jgi:hypothetical protein